MVSRRLQRFVDIELDRPRQMALPLGALEDAERELNKLRAAEGLEPIAIFKAVDEQIAATQASGAVSARVMFILLWASLLHEDPALTLAQVKAMPINAMYCATKVFECVRHWMQAPADEVDDAEPAPASQEKKLNGSISGPLAASTSD